MQKDKTMTEAEYRLAELIWENAPIGSGELVQLCTERLGWKKSTTYTMLRKLCALGMARNERAMVTAAVSRDEYHRLRGEAVIQEGFDGSLPRFLAAFVEKRGISEADAAELKMMIDRWEEKHHG